MKSSGFGGEMCDAEKEAVAANTWPVYTPDDAQVFLFSANESSYAEPDLYRAEGIQYVSELMLARHGTNCTGLLACGVSDTN